MIRIVCNVLLTLFFLSSFNCYRDGFLEEFEKLKRSKQAEIYGKVFLAFLEEEKYAQAYLLLSKKSKRISSYESFLSNGQFVFKKSGGVVKRGGEEFFKDYEPGIPTEGKTYWYAKYHLETKNYPLGDEYIKVIREDGEYRVQLYNFQKSKEKKSSFANIQFTQGQTTLIKMLKDKIENDLLTYTGGKQNKYSLKYVKIDKSRYDELMKKSAEILNNIKGRKYTEYLKQFDVDGFLTRLYKSDIRGFEYRGRYSLSNVRSGVKFDEILVYDLNVVNRGNWNKKNKGKRVGLCLYFYFSKNQLIRLSFIGISPEDSYSYYFIYDE